MSFLAEVLSLAEKVKIDEINHKVPELKISVEKLKSELMQYIDNVYIRYSGRPRENRKLLDTAQDLEEEIVTLLKHADNATKKQLIKSGKELTEHVDNLNTLNFTLQVLQKLCQINEGLAEFTMLLSCKEYLRSREIISNLEKILSEMSDEEQVAVVTKLKFNIIEKKTRLLEELKNVFKKEIIEQNKDSTASVKVMLKVDLLKEVILALSYKETVIYTLCNFAKFLWLNFFVPIVDSTVVVKVECNDQFSLIQINIIDSNKKSAYNEVFSNLKIVLEFLNEYFNFPLDASTPALTTLEYIGSDIRDNLSELLIKHCLEDTIPATVEDLKNYNIVIEETEKLEKSLKDYKIFCENTTSLVKFTNNIDVLFINKKCQEYSVQSMQFMKKDLHDMEEVGIPYSPDKPLGFEVDQFLQCSISKHVIELLNYCENILKQAIDNTDVNASKIVVTVQNIFINYTTFVPEYHHKLLKTIPQQVALFHNNCMYIAHKLTEWKKLYLLKFQSSLNLPGTFMEQEISQLRQVSSEIFISYVKEQIKQINDIMKESGLDGAMLVKNLDPLTEKCVRQCLRQQELLKTVWHKVLSYCIYNKTIGTILNSLCKNLIDPIINFEDISSASAEQLAEIIKMVLNRGPKLFSDTKEVSLYVSLWYKLSELNFILGATLADINDRWADGKGPLALQFKPLELKTLIRALFQNTDKRAAILSKIQE